MSLPGPVVAIVGPTASGKSALADAVALRLTSSVISVDAMQVYRGMDIGTAKTPVESRPVPLLMVDIADVACAYSVQQFQKDARTCVDEVLSEGHVPVLCGGTGLYLNSVIDDMEYPSGEVGSETRAAYERIAEEDGPLALHALLARRDPKSAELIHPNNVRRVVRALELLDEGVSYAENNQGLHQRNLVYDARVWGVGMSRERLYERINRRVDDMFEAGLVDEVKRLEDLGLRDSKTARQAIGYKEVLEAIDGICTLEEARETVKMRTRRYAKRQLSWFGHDKRVRWIDFDSTTLDEARDIIVADCGGAHGSV